MPKTANRTTHAENGDCGSGCGCCGSGCGCGCCSDSGGNGCDCGCNCGCCGDGRFKRRYRTKAERIAELEAYLEELKLEERAVEERLADLKKKK